MEHTNEMTVSLYAVGSNLIAKIGLIFSTGWSWITTALMIISAYFLPIKEILIIIFAFVSIDFILGVYIHRKTLQSSKFRESILKLFIYLFFICSLFSVESQIGTAFLYKVVFSVASLTELYSICANLLVIAPNIPVLKLFKNLLAVEISKKIDNKIDTKQVTDILDKKEEIENK